MTAPVHGEVPEPGSEQPGLTGIVPALNEEKNLEACLQSFKEICDEIIVVDSFSSDATVEIAKRYTDRVYQRKWADYRTFLKFVSPRLRAEIRARVDADGRDANGLVGCGRARRRDPAATQRHLRRLRSG